MKKQDEQRMHELEIDRVRLRPMLVPVLARAKASIANWPEDWQMAWAERAAILEYDAEHDRDSAEMAAFWQVQKRRLQGDTP